jgi:hypothetical protein
VVRTPACSQSKSTENPRLFLVNLLSGIDELTWWNENFWNGLELSGSADWLLLSLIISHCEHLVEFCSGWSQWKLNASLRNFFDFVCKLSISNLNYLREFFLKIKETRMEKSEREENKKKYLTLGIQSLLKRAMISWCYLLYCFKSEYEGVSKSFRTESITRCMLTTINTRWEATQRIMAAKLNRLTHKIVTQLHLVAESCTICSSRSRRPVRKLLDAPSYVATSINFYM